MSWERIKQWFRGLKSIKNKPIKNNEIKTGKQEKTKKTTKNYRAYTVSELRRIILINYPPFTWEKVGLLLYKEFTSRGKNFTKLKDNDIIPPDLVQCINNALYMFYKKELPKE